jgi:hypothetical protein
MGSAIFRLCVLGFLLVGTGYRLCGETRILLSENASVLEHNAARELKTDILKVYPGESVAIGTYPQTDNTGFSGNTISMGTQESLPQYSLEKPLEPETFQLKTVSSGLANEEAHLVILGGDERGLFYGVYEFSKQVLGIDPMEYWTGRKPVPAESFTIPDIDYRESPPVFKLRGYFDNDNDMLANWKGRKLIIEFDTWMEMIDSLARLRFNYIDIHDTLGRPEFYLREYYTKMTEYHTDLELVDQIIDYAHSKAMLVQIPMYLGWEFEHLGMDEVCLTANFDRWMEIYIHYLTETPLGKGDLFLARPRHPIYDWAYSCPEEEALGILPGPLLAVVFSGLGKLLQKYRPGGILICDLWQEGRDLWKDGSFSPKQAVQMLWADNGFAEMETWPDRMKTHSFGVYVHAGVWKNQVVQDPYPERIEMLSREAASRGMTANFFVNGQNFKPFILNLEACARAAWDPSGFDADSYYREWTSRYFGKTAAPTIMESLQYLHKAHDYSVGFREVTKHSTQLIKKMQSGTMEPEDLASVRTALALARKSLELAEEAQPLVQETALPVFDDQIRFPCQLYVRNLELLKSLIEFSNDFRLLSGNWSLKARETASLSGALAREKLLDLHAVLERGSRWEKWKGWTHPTNFRIHTPPPTLIDLEVVLQKLK